VALESCFGRQWIVIVCTVLNGRTLVALTALVAVLADNDMVDDVVWGSLACQAGVDWI
jgi:hypothetical protein